MSIPAYALSTCNERNHNLDDSLKDAMCSKCQTWANEKYIGRNVGKKIKGLPVKGNFIVCK